MNESERPRDEVEPEGKWKFDGAVADVFDDMLERSIPQYHIMRELCFEIGKRFVVPKLDVVDLGCARGEALDPFIRKFGAYNRYIACDVSEPMLSAARVRFDGYIKCGVADVRRVDLRHEYPASVACLTLGVLTIQFTPIEHRPRILAKVAEHTAHSGAFLLVEKVISSDAKIDETFSEVYVDAKKANGYSDEQIARKRLSLEGVLVPMTEEANVSFLRNAGFSKVECFWRWANFAGWLAVK
jgi:tRNA (cmo5U34)-methyltransferase